MSLEALCERLNEWCDTHRVVPASGQAGERMTERSVRYYRTLGLVDAPEGGGYGEKHLLQLMAARLLQAQGLPLRRIRELLYGRSVDELREVRDRGLAEAGRAAAARQISLPVAHELWRMMPLDDDFLLVSRRGTLLTPAQCDAVRAALPAHARPASSPHHSTE
jgi:DNA-binding transcriptional MerR regulator